MIRPFICWHETDANKLALTIVAKDVDKAFYSYRFSSECYESPISVLDVVHNKIYLVEESTGGYLAVVEIPKEIYGVVKEEEKVKDEEHNPALDEI
jgi:hypothetical protein